MFLATFISISLSPPVSGVASDGGGSPAPQEPYSGAAAAEAEQVRDCQNTLMIIFKIQLKCGHTKWIISSTNAKFMGVEAQEYLLPSLLDQEL